MYSDGKTSLVFFVGRNERVSIAFEPKPYSAPPLLLLLFFVCCGGEKVDLVLELLAGLKAKASEEAKNDARER
jgi:hypothetical protein